MAYPYYPAWRDDKIHLIHKSLLHATENNDVIFQVLDRIYSLALTQWNAYLSALTQLLLEQANADRYNVLLKEVTAELLKTLKK